jgi:O-antigen/teichoic acid export membrane protein
MYMLPLTVIPILTRLYTPEIFGEWGVFSSFVAIVNIGLFLGFENVIIQAKEEELSKIIKLCITISASIIVIIAIIFYGGIKGEFHFFTNFPTPPILIIYLSIYLK